MTIYSWLTIATAMGLACVPVCRWWVRSCDYREPKFTCVWRQMK